jgi:negative regulator of flagellin synthesis FlgM
MKIGPLVPKPVTPVTVERKTSNAAGGSKPEPGTQVALSPAAEKLSVSSGDASFDGAKVERIAQAIRDGKFTVNPEAIADKLIANATELLARKPS